MPRPNPAKQIGVTGIDKQHRPGPGACPRATRRQRSAHWMAEQRWVVRLGSPDHDVTVATVFRALTREPELLPASVREPGEKGE